MSPFAEQGYECWDCEYFCDGHCTQRHMRVSSSNPACGDFELDGYSRWLKEQSPLRSRYNP